MIKNDKLITNNNSNVSEHEQLSYCFTVNVVVKCITNYSQVLPSDSV